MLTNGIVGFARGFPSFVDGDADALLLDTEEKAPTSTKSLRRSGLRHLTGSVTSVGGGSSGFGGASNNGLASARDTSTGSVTSGVYGKGKRGCGTAGSSKAPSVNGSIGATTTSSTGRNQSHGTGGVGVRDSGCRGGGGSRGGRGLRNRVNDTPDGRGVGGFCGNDGIHGLNSGSTACSIGGNHDDNSGSQQQRQRQHLQHLSKQQCGVFSSPAGRTPVAERPSPLPPSTNGSHSKNTANNASSGTILAESQSREVPPSFMHQGTYLDCSRSPGCDVHQHPEEVESKCGGRDSAGGVAAAGYADAPSAVRATLAGPSGQGLVEAAAAASAARRRRLDDGDGGAERDMSRGSAASVAESIISRATARRGRW